MRAAQGRLSGTDGALKGKARPIRLPQPSAPRPYNCRDRHSSRLSASSLQLHGRLRREAEPASQMDAAAARRVGTPVVVALAAVTTAAAFLRYYAIGRQGFWYDEATTAWLVRATPAQMLAQLPHTESTPPLYYLLAWGWVRLFGDTQTGLRSLSALAGVITVPVAFAAAREL